MTRQVNFSIEDRAFATLERLAGQHGYKPTSYAKMLFEAAFASRLQVQVDRGIDDQVAVAIVLHGAKKDSATIAQAVGLSEATVIRIIDAWRSERIAA